MENGPFVNGLPIKNGDKKLSHIELERSTMFNGWSNYFDWAMASMSQTLTVITGG